MYRCHDEVLDGVTQSYYRQKSILISNKSDPLVSARSSSPNNDLKHKATNSTESVTSQNKESKPKRKRPPRVTANLAGTRYEVVRTVAQGLGFRVAKDEDPGCYLIWNDAFVSTDRISDLKAYQRINHFPGMGEICRKDCLARNMSKMAKAMPSEFNFVPKTWILPGEMPQLQAYCKEMKKKKKFRTFIAKPANGAMGNGISLFRNVEKLPQIQEPTIVQEYLDKPFLVDGYKTDMRIYVLMTSCDPLRLFLFNDGLLRMSTEKYTHPTDSNIENTYMHLTNYSVNKHNENYKKDESTHSGSKRSLKYFNDYLLRNDYDVHALWSSITEMLVKTMLVALPHVLHAYRMCRPGQPPGSDSVCFEVLGFDIMLDRKLRPWLLEINRSPSFGTDEALDKEIKTGVLEDTFKLLNIKLSDKRRNMTQQKYMVQRRLQRHQQKMEGDERVADRARKKEELKEWLVRVRRDAQREEFENRNCNRFKRIFPSDDKFRRKKHSEIILGAFNTFLAGRATSLQRELEYTYVKEIKEIEIRDMLAQYESDEVAMPGVGPAKNKRGPKKPSFLPPIYQLSDTDESGWSGDDLDIKPAPLLSMPVRENTRPILRDTYSADEGEEQEDEDYEADSDDERQGKHTGRSRAGALLSNRPSSRTSGFSRPMSGTSRPRSQLVDTQEDHSAKQRRDELTLKTLNALNDMKIKFPGKSDTEAEQILERLHNNWKFHKPRIASYWLVKLDSIKRRKVVDIVRSNVRAVLQRTWHTGDVDSLPIYRIFSRVFNRLLWSHGQGLWNCFQSSGNSWETIFSKSSDAILPTELACCQRIVQLCKDCLLVVYQFATDAKTTTPNSLSDSERHPSPMRYMGIPNNGETMVFMLSGHHQVSEPTDLRTFLTL